MTDAEAAPAAGLRVRGLVVSRVVDQATLGLGSLVLARHLGPAAFAPVATLFVFNSLAVQLADHGASFALLRSAPGTTLSSARLHRMRWINAGVVAVAVVLGLAIPGARPWLVGGGLVWAVAAEAYIRRSSWLKAGRPDRVVRAELVAAGAFAVGVGAVVVLDAGPAWIAALFVARHVVELLLTGFAPGSIGPSGVTTSGAEWVGQVMTYVASNVDYAVVAIALDDVALSLYVIAYRFASAIPALVSLPITQQAFVGLAAAGEDHPRLHRRLVGRAFSVGLLGVLAVIAAAVVAVAYLGSDWTDVGPLATVLSVAVPWRMILGVVVATGLTAGFTRRIAVAEGARAAVIGAAVAIGSGWGLFGCAAAATAATVASIGAEHVATSRWSDLPLDRRLVAATVVAPFLAIAAAVLLAP